MPLARRASEPRRAISSVVVRSTSPVPEGSAPSTDSTTRRAPPRRLKTSVSVHGGGSTGSVGCAAVGHRRDGIEDVLVEQLGPADDEEHQSGAERQRAGDPGDFPELRLDGRVDDDPRHDIENDREAG